MLSEHTEIINTLVTSDASFTNKCNMIEREMKEVSSVTLNNSKDISGINEEQTIHINRLDVIEGNIKNHEDHLMQIDDSLDGIQSNFGVSAQVHAGWWVAMALFEPQYLFYILCTP